MKQTKKWKKLVTLSSIALFGMSALFSPATTLTAEAATAESTISPCADILQWMYKIEGTSLYRRLYNTTTDSWVGNWEYVGEISS